MACITEENKTVFYISATETSKLHGQSLEFTRGKKKNSKSDPFPQKIPNPHFKQKKEQYEKSRILAHMSERGKSGGLKEGRAQKLKRTYLQE